MRSMCERETIGRFNLNTLFSRYLKEPKNPNVLSAQIKIDGKSAEEVLREYVAFWESSGLEYRPKTLLDALLSFAPERNATNEEISKIAFTMGQAYPFDFDLTV